MLHCIVNMFLFYHQHSVECDRLVLEFQSWVFLIIMTHSVLSMYILLKRFPQNQIWTSDLSGTFFFRSQEDVWRWFFEPVGTSVALLTLVIYLYLIWIVSLTSVRVHLFEKSDFDLRVIKMWGNYFSDFDLGEYALFLYSNTVITCP